MGDNLLNKYDDYFKKAKHPVDRWQYLQKLHQKFCVSWKKEYLHRLNTRSKWKKEEIAYETGDLKIVTVTESKVTMDCMNSGRIS
uniref:DUF5641 domain-containing protein n=1 Tax=Megaselia scalaris TaxID=36166 RepID=T1GQD9_MEGSC